MPRRADRFLLLLLVAAVVAIVGAARWREARPSAGPSEVLPRLNVRGAPPSSPQGLAARVTDMRRRLDANPEDVAAAVVLAEALLRQSRAAGTGAAAAQSEQVLRRALRVAPDGYEARQLLGATLLSLHRFRDALEAAQRARDLRPDDAWNYGVIGDAALELGDYDTGFSAFQRMMDLRPTAAAYARASYARELQGDMDGAFQNMQLAFNATPPGDPEARAWTLTQYGELLLRAGRVEEAERHFAAAGRTYPSYALARMGMARARVARGAEDQALSMALDLFGDAPSLPLAAMIGDLLRHRRRDEEAERYYRLAETIGGQGLSGESVAGFLAERGRQPEEVVALAQRAAAERRDIFTMDALAWALYRAGRLEEARTASSDAQRTGTRDRRILHHAAAIHRALGNHGRADALLARALPIHPEFDLVTGPRSTAFALRSAVAPAARPARR